MMEQYKQDALRYRWLREHSYHVNDKTGTIYFGGGFAQTEPMRLDTVIDAALKLERLGKPPKIKPSQRGSHD